MAGRRGYTAGRAALIDSTRPVGTLVPMKAAPGTMRSSFPESAGWSDLEIDSKTVVPKELEPWQVIWSIGGAVWLAVACISLAWFAPWNGTWYEGKYVPSTAGLALKHAMVFLATATSYRAVLAMGWPKQPSARLRVGLVNVLLVLSVLAWSEVVDAFVTGFIDGRYAYMRVKFHALPGLYWRLDWLVSLARAYCIPYALGLCAIVLALVINRRHGEAMRTVELGRVYSATRLALLSAQLQPHFLFNTLNALTELIKEDPDKASAMVVQLGSFLRHALESELTPWVALAKELDGLQTYLDIQRIRFGDGLRIFLDVSPTALAIHVPALILQPLVENAIKHGRREGGPPLGISIEIANSEKHLLICVRNTRPRIVGRLLPQDYGRGLSNVELRLRTAYGNSGHLAIEPDPTGGTAAILRLPIRLSIDLGMGPS